MTDRTAMPTPRNGEQCNGGSPQSNRFGIDRIARPQKTALFIAPGISLEKWKVVGLQIHRIADSSCWWLGDWLVYGERNYPRRYRDAVEQTGLDYQTLRNYAWVARSFEMSRRRDILSFQHHAELAALPESQQDMWLTRAAEFGWSRRRLRTELRDARNGKESADQLARENVLEIKADPGQRQRWLDAAQKADVSLVDWIASTLDEAATAALYTESRQD